MGIKEMITKDELSRCVKTFSQIVFNKIYIIKTGKENLYHDAGKCAVWSEPLRKLKIHAVHVHVTAIENLMHLNHKRNNN